jgi:hypothetical protein
LEKINNNGDKLIDVCEQNSLKMLNGYFKHNMIHKYTWHEDAQKLRSIKDYTISRKNSGLKFQNVSLLRGMTVGNDHYLVKATILFYWEICK